MNAFVKVPQIALAILVCIVLSSCAKDTDLVSGFIINTPKQKKDVSMVYDTNVKVKVPEVDIKIDVFSTKEIPRWEKIQINKTSQQVAEINFSE